MQLLVFVSFFYLKMKLEDKPCIKGLQVGEEKQGEFLQKAVVFLQLEHPH